MCQRSLQPCNGGWQLLGLAKKVGVPGGKTQFAVEDQPYHKRLHLMPVATWLLHGRLLLLCDLCPFLVAAPLPAAVSEDAEDELQPQRRQVALVISSTASATAGHRQRNTTLEPALQGVPLHMAPLTLALWLMTLQLLQQQECWCMA